MKDNKGRTATNESGAYLKGSKSKRTRLRRPAHSCIPKRPVERVALEIIGQSIADEYYTRERIRELYEFAIKHGWRPK